MFKSISRRNRAWFVFGTDVILLIISFYGAFLLRFDFTIPSEYLQSTGSMLIVMILTKASLLYLFGLYRGMFRYTSLWDLFNIVKATTISSLIIVAGFGIIVGFQGFPRSIFLLDYFLTTGFISISRISIRLYFSHIIQSSFFNQTADKIKIILIGAGNTGEKIARDILENPKTEFQIVGFVDDDPQKHRTSIHGIPILGSLENISRINVPYDELLITAPSSTSLEMRRIVELCKSTGKRYRTVPSFAELMNNDVSINTIRDVSLMDLLGREEVKLDMSTMDKFLKGKRILVTGAGGSIGSELVRQCLSFNPGLLILLDNSENNLFTIEQECENLKESTTIKSILGNIRNEACLSKMFKEYRPQVVLHAAAYKHVPIQELHPWSAVLTNVLGTLNLAELSRKFRVERFVLVSTDKAVHPVNVMGATKRLSERIVQSIDGGDALAFIAVRFGNVIGSSGSVIPIFKNQIQKGGPVTITHPEMTRYFMSIPEAAQLILQAGAMGSGSEIFVLDMGKPIKIKDMAYDLIRLSGFEPEADIPIIYTGLRPGEKLYEELVTRKERVNHTEHEKILILRDTVIKQSWSSLKKEIESLVIIASSFDSDAIKQKLKLLIPEYEPQDYFPHPEDFDVDITHVKGQA